MSKILVIPDVHGRKFWHKAEELINEVDKIIFLGDYLDPYFWEGITFETAMEEFKNILSFKQKNPEKVILLTGNHDIHYIILEFMNCSRLNLYDRVKIHELFQSNIDKFNLIYQHDNYLFSHSGIYREWMYKYNITLEELFDLKTFFQNRWKTLEDVGVYRGGWDKVGSCIWADIRERIEHTVIPNFIQIVGHTLSDEPEFWFKDIICLDCRRCFILNTETGEINEVC